VDSRGTGTAQFWLSEDGTELHYRLLVANLGGITQAHIHIGGPAGTGPEASGPFVVFLFDLVPTGATERGLIAEGTITAADLIARSNIAFGATMPELIAAMDAGNAYVNVHTLAFPGGEIRGQIR
jgi:hypothetical protein